jgi:hypothetical protein
MATKYDVLIWKVIHYLNYLMPKRLRKKVLLAKGAIFLGEGVNMYLLAAFLNKP